MTVDSIPPLAAIRRFVVGCGTLYALCSHIEYRMSKPKSKTARAWLLALVAVGGLLTLYNSAFFVDQAHLAVLTRLGRPVGRPIADPGLHFKIPFIQEARYIPRPDAKPSFENSLVLAPLYVQYLTDSAEKFGVEARELQNRIGRGPYVLLGFACFLYVTFPELELSTPITPEQMSQSLQEIDTIVQRARDNGLVTHISVVSGFFHGWNQLRESAIRQDVRNAQWFADGFIAPPDDLKDPTTIPHTIWITPSRYAIPLRSRIEEGVRIIGTRLAQRMAESKETLASIGGDGEVELTLERNFLGAGEKLADRAEIIYADYSPFMVAEFRDWLRRDFHGDLTPASD